MEHDPPIILNYTEENKPIHKYHSSIASNSDHTISHCSDCAKDLFTYITIGSPYELENETDKNMR